MRQTISDSLSRAHSDINLEFNGYGYRWTGKSVPVRLQGLWLSPIDANNAAIEYQSQITKKAEKKALLVNYERTDLEELDILTRKDELLSFANSRGIDVPQDKKNPSSIKAFVKKSLEMVNA